jgi:hypothetical protein
MPGIERVRLLPVRRFAMGKDEQAIGTEEGGREKAQNSGVEVSPGPAENPENPINPSAPGETGTTPGTHGK